MIRFIVGQKQINLSRLIAVTCCALLTLSGNAMSVKGAEVRSPNKTFADWCHQKDDLSPETKHTVEVLLKIAGTTECDAANQKLSSLTELALNNNQISDIKPLASLTNLTQLFLGNNQISDLIPLQSLTNIQNLHLNNNQISDLKPLEFLTNLNWLDLNNNQISDLKPLQSLTNLYWLDLSNNQISDLKPLQSLTDLHWLYLAGNPIAPKICPLQPESICRWEPPIVVPVPEPDDDSAPEIKKQRVERLYLDGGCAADKVRSRVPVPHRLQSGGDCREGRS
ncbi:MAG: leucine-rich repeat domain-containing protein [Microcoleus sp.]